MLTIFKLAMTCVAAFQHRFVRLGRCCKVFGLGCGIELRTQFFRGLRVLDPVFGVFGWLAAKQQVAAFRQNQ